MVGFSKLKLTETFLTAVLKFDFFVLLVLQLFWSTISKFEDQTSGVNVHSRFFILSEHIQ